METRNTERVRFRYGICLNDNCEKCKSKEVQEIPARKDFVCQNPECGKPLRECPPPKKGGKGKYIAIIAGIGVLAIIGGIIAMGGGDKDMKETPQTATVQEKNEDSLRAAQMEAENHKLRDSLAAVQTELEKQQQEDSLAVDESDKAKEQDVSAEKPKAIPAQAPVTTPARVPAPTPDPAPKSKQASSGSKNLGYAVFKGSWPNDVNGRMVFTSSHAIDSRDPKRRVAESGDYVIGEWVNGHLVQGIWYGADNQVKGSIIIGQ